VLTGRYACYDTYRTADGRWLAVAAIEAKFFANLCRALRCEQWVGHQYDDEVQDAVRRDLAAAFARRDRDDWVSELSGADTCVAPVQAVSEIGADPQYAFRGAVVEAKHGARGTFRQVGAVLAGMAPLTEPVCVPDVEATDTDELLEAAGIPAEQVAAWRARKVIA
jgi:crotonobetainyl-CoA:carnitine CoA-transferase CaiB-like acyl-CoA transferase